MKRLTPFDFIERAVLVHGDKYDYSEIKYVYLSEKVTIICREHDYKFQQRPSDHLRGSGCNLCSGKKKKTTDEFVQRAKQVHGETYIYDKVNYINSQTKVIITCKVHGDFEQNTNNHLNGLGCGKCGGTYKISKEEFIEKAKEIHGNKYNYDKVNYLNQNIKVVISCHLHGEFEQQPRHHLKGFGCSACSGKKKKNTNEFIERAKEVHGETYSYDKANYINGKAKAVITCKVHGDFEQNASEHLTGKGCPKCGGRQKGTSDSFIKRAKEVHNDRYNYDRTIYINNRTSVIITCLKHGDFQQSPSSHLQGKGCLTCSGQKRLTKEEFVEKAKQVHGDKYNYDKAIYINNNTKLTITCPFHGDFEQAANHHISQKHGCLLCGGSKKWTIEEFIEKAKQVHGNKYRYDKATYISNNTKITITCPFHGDFEQAPNNHISQRHGCRKCNIPKGEAKIESCLIETKIMFSEQYTFDDCIDKKMLPFDFAIFISNKIGLIEYQGEQHYKEVNFGKRGNQLSACKKRDDIKADYAKTKEIPLLIISYYDFDKINELIRNFVREHFSLQPTSLKKGKT